MEPGISLARFLNYPMPPGLSGIDALAGCPARCGHRLKPRFQAIGRLPLTLPTEKPGKRHQPLLADLRLERVRDQPLSPIEQLRPL